MNIDQFLEKYANKKWDFDGMYGAQCFDLFQFYNRDVVGAPFVTGAAAKDIWNTYPKDYYEQIANAPTNFPVKGDVVIWGSDYGPFGHVAICTEGDVNKFTCLSQNDPPGMMSIYKTYTSWKGVLGWIRPKKKEDALQSCLKQHAELVTQLNIANEKCSTLRDDVSRLTLELTNTKLDLEKALNSQKTLLGENSMLEKKLIDITKIINA